MKKFKKILSVFLLISILLGTFAPTVSAAVAKGDAITKKYFRNAAFGKATTVGHWGVDIHYVNGDETKPFYCLEREKEAGANVQQAWNGKGLLQKSDYWLALSPAKKDAIIRTLLNGYPNYKGDYGTGATKNDKMYATQILVWEFTSDVRSPSNFKKGPISDKDYMFQDAFKKSYINDYDTMMPLTVDKNGVFSKALAYHDKLVDAVKNHFSVPSVPRDTDGLYGKTVTIKIKDADKFSYKSSNTGVASFKSSNSTSVSFNINNKGSAKITATKKNSVKSAELQAPVIISSGDNKQQLMYGVLEDPVTFAFNINAQLTGNGGIGILKTDANGNIVKGAKFDVFDKNKNKLDTITTNGCGYALYGGLAPTSFNLPAGETYYLKEVASGENYLSVNSGYIKMKAVDNYWCLSDGYNVGKNADTSGTTIGYGPLSSTIKGKGDFSLYAQVNGAYVNGLKVTLYKTAADAEANKNPYRTFTTNSSGESLNNHVDVRTGSNTYYWVKIVDEGNSSAKLTSIILPIKVYEGMVTRFRVRFHNDSYAMRNEFKGAVAIAKTDAQGNKLPGAKFGLYENSNCTVPYKRNGQNVTVTTNSNGVGYVSDIDVLTEYDIEPGKTIYFKEIQAPDGYQISSDVYSATVQSGKTVFASKTSGNTTISYERELSPTGHCQLRIIGPKNASYKVEYINSKGVLESRIDKSGSTGIMLYKYVTPGINHFITMVNNGYASKPYDGVTYKMRSYVNSTVTLDYSTSGMATNQELGAIGVKKVNTSGEPLSNAVFGVYKSRSDADSGSKEIATIKTGSDGCGYYGKSGSVYSLVPGTTYYVKEVIPPYDYVPNNTVYSAKVESGKINYVSSNGSAKVVNTQKGGIGVLKTNNFGAAVDGVGFGVYNTETDAKNDKNRIHTMVTHSGGWAEYGGGYITNFDLTPGKTYYVKEISGPSNIVRDSDIRAVPVNPNKWYLLNETGYSTVHYASNANLDKGRIKIKAELDGSGVGGIGYKIYTSYEDAMNETNPVKSGITLEDGWITFENLNSGTYYVKNTSTTKNDIRISNVLIPVKAYRGIETQVYWRYSGSADEANLHNVSVINSLRGAVGVKKVDEAGNAISGVSFGVYSDSSCKNQIDTVVTNFGGVAYYGGEKLDNFTLEPGKIYYFKELNPKFGYGYNDEILSAKVASGKVVFAKGKSNGSNTSSVGYYTAGDYANGVHHIRIYTDYTTSSFKIMKYNSNTKQRELVETIKMNGKTSERGRELTPGVYYVQLSSSNSSPDYTIYTAQVIEGCVTNVYAYKNTSLVNERRGGIGVLKEDSNGNPIPNVVFGIYETEANAKGNKYKLGEIKTNSMGYASYGGQFLGDFKLVPDKTYYVKELSTPEYYVPSDKVYPIKVNAKYWTLCNGYIRSDNISNGTTIGYSERDDCKQGEGYINFHTLFNGVYGDGAKIYIYETAEAAKEFRTPYEVLNVGSSGDLENISIKEKNGANNSYYMRIYSLNNETAVQSGAILPFKVYNGYETNIFLRFNNDRMSIVNKNRGSIAVMKSDENGNPLENAEFTVYKDRNCHQKAEGNSVIVTDKNGYASYGGTLIGGFKLVPGTTYYIKETKAPSGYVLNDNVMQATVEDNKVVFANPHFSNSHNWIFYNTLGGYRDSLAGIRVYLPRANISVTVTNSANASKKKTLKSSAYTGKNGTYYKVEFDSSFIEANQSYYVCVSSANDKKSIGSNKYLVKAYNGCITTLALKNDGYIENSKVAKLIVEKTCDVGSAVGFRFHLVGIDSATQGVNLYKTTVAKNGDTTTGYAEFTNLPFGNYRLEEVTQKGFLKWGPKEIKLSSGTIKTEKVVNHHITQKLRIQKKITIPTGGSGGTLSGWMFNVKGPSYPNGAIFETNSKGIIDLNVIVGKYTITELPEKKQKNKGAYCKNYEKVVDVTEGSSKIVLVEFENIYRQFVIKKVDEYGEPMSNIKFGIFGDAACKRKIAEIKTNSKGLAYFNGFAEGTYYIKELSAPNGYMVSPEVKRLVVNSNWRNSNLNWIVKNNLIYDVPTGVEILTTGLVSSLAIAGVGIGLLIFFKRRKNK